MVVQFGIAPSEFWKMSPFEVGFYIDSKVADMSNEMPDHIFHQIEDNKKRLRDEGVNVI